MKLPLPLCRWLWRQDWIGLPWKKSAYRALNNVGETPDAPFEADFFGLRYQGNLSNGIEFALYYYGAFEKPLLFFLRDALLKLQKSRGADACFCDIGANIGQHSLFMSQYGAAVHAFEPFDAVRARLEHHIQLNQLRNITVHPIGLGRETHHQTFYAPTGSNQGVGSFIEDSQQKGNEAIGDLQIFNGDDYFGQQGIVNPVLIKIDVEGLEKEVLEGLQSTLGRVRPVIAVEVSYGESRSFTSRESLLAILPADYLIYRFDTRKADGSTARRRGSRAKRTGAYRLIAMNEWYAKDQDDLVLVPAEFLPELPLSNQAE